MSTLPAGSVVAALDEATAAGLLVELPGAAERFAFAHALVHRTLLERLTRAHRRRLHARIADALQRSGRAELRDVAHHLCEAGPAGDVDAAVDVAEKAADQALRNLAHAEAMELYIRAIALLPADDPAAGCWRCAGCSPSRRSPTRRWTGPATAARHPG